MAPLSQLDIWKQRFRTSCTVAIPFRCPIRLDLEPEWSGGTPLPGADFELDQGDDKYAAALSHIL